MRGELSKSGKKWPRYRLPKFVDCPTFFTTRRVPLGIGLVAHKPVAGLTGHSFAAPSTPVCDQLAAPLHVCA